MIMPKELKKYITVDKNILQGTPVISGTRIPVARLFSLVRQGYNTETFREEYPHVSYIKIQRLMAYLMKAGFDAVTQEIQTSVR